MVVGLVGCGAWGRHILRDLRDLGCEIAVVARSEASRERAQAGGAATVVQDVASLPRVDGVVVATSTSAHASVLHEALELDVPVFCEKPLCTDPAEAARLAERAPERLFVMDKWRYHAGVGELAAIARDGRLGAVSGLKTFRLGWEDPHDDVDPVWVLTPHDLSIALEILGSLPVPEASVLQRVGDRAVQLSAVLRVPGGAWHTLAVSRRSPERVRRVELHCAGGVAVLAGGWDQEVTLYRDGESGIEEERIATPGELPLLAELRAFVAHLEGGPAPRSSAAEGAAIVGAIAELRRLAG